jgi:hypothetical protein
MLSHVVSVPVLLVTGASAQSGPVVLAGHHLRCCQLGEAICIGRCRAQMSVEWCGGYRLRSSR